MTMSMSDRIKRAIDEARMRWPGIAIGDEVLVAAVSGAEEAHVATRGDELVLVAAIVAKDTVALQAFEREIVPTGRAAIARYLRDAARVDEVVQQLRIHLLVGTPPLITRFDGRAPLSAWVATCGARLALHALRGDRAHPTVEWSDALADLEAGVAELPEHARRNEALGRALEEACLQLSRRHRAVIRRLFVDRAGIDDVAAMYRVHRVTVWRWVQEACAVLRAELRESLGDSVGTATIAGAPSLERVLASTETDIRD